MNSRLAQLIPGFVLVWTLGVVCDVADAQTTWRGKWNNQRFGTSGPLQCVATETSPGQWDATFTGTFQGDPFEYQASFRSRKDGRGLQLSGQSRIDGHQYEWTGAISGQQLRGQYRNNIGYHGEFILGELTSAPRRGQTPLRSGGASPRSGTHRRNQQAREDTPDFATEDWDAVVDDGHRLLFIGNSFMANEGGVYHYLEKAADKIQLQLQTKDLIFPGKPLKGMLRPEVASQIDSDDFDSVVFTSGNATVMQQFATRIKKTKKQPIVLMTWAPQHPGNRSSEAKYTAATKRSVREMRALERDHGVLVIPTAVVFHDLTVRPPIEMPRVNYLWRENNIHQNELGTMVNAWMLYAILTGQSPVGVNFNMPPHIVGQKLLETPEIRFDRNLRLALQQRVWSIARAWKSGQTHLD